MCQFEQEILRHGQPGHVLAAHLRRPPRRRRRRLARRRPWLLVHRAAAAPRRPRPPKAWEPASRRANLVKPKIATRYA